MPYSYRNFKGLFWLALIFLLICTSFVSAQDTFTASTSGNWSTGGNWTIVRDGNNPGTNSYPGESLANQSADGPDIVEIPAGFNMTLDLSPATSVGSLTIQAGAGTELDMNANTLSVTGAVVINGDLDDTGAGATLNVGGDFTINSGATWDQSGGYITLNFNGTSGTQTIGGSFAGGQLAFENFNISASGAIVNNTLSTEFYIATQFNLSAGTFEAGSATYTIDHTATNNFAAFNKTGGTLTAETSTFLIKGNRNLRMVIDSGTSFYRITHQPTSARSLTFDGAAVYTITNQLSFTPNSSSVSFLNGASFVFSGTTTLSYTTNQATWTIGGEWPSSTSDDPTNVTVNSTGTFTLGSSRTVSGTFTQTGGGTFDVSGGILTVDGTFSKGSGSFTTSGGALAYGGSALLTYTSGQTAGVEWPATVPNVTVQSGAVTLSGVAGKTISNTLTVSGTLSAGGNALSIGNDLTVNGSLTTSNALVSVTDATTLGASATLNTNGANFSTGGNLVINASASLTSGGGTVDVTGTSTLAGSATISSTAGAVTLTGNVAMNHASQINTTGNATLVGDLTVSGTAQIGQDAAGTLIMGGAQNVNVNLNGTLELFNYNVNKTFGSSVTVTAQNGSQLRFNPNGLFRVQQGIMALSSTSQILDPTGGTINDDNITLQVDANGTFRTGGTEITGFATLTLADGSTIEFSGTGSEDIPSGIYGNITISNTYVNGVGLLGAVTLQANSSITVNSGSVLNLAGQTVTNGGASDALVVAGTLNTGGSSLAGYNDYQLSGVVNFNGTSGHETLPSGVSGDAFSLTVNKSGGTNLVIDAAVTVGGTSKTLTLTNGLITFSGSGALTLASGTALNGGGAAAYVEGTLSREFATGSDVTATFPIGVSNNYRPVNVVVGSVSGANEVITVTQNESAPSGSLPSGFTGFATGLSRYWSITNSGGGTLGGNVTLTFNTTGTSDAGSVLNLVGGTNATSYTVAGSSTSFSLPNLSAAFVAADFEANNDFAAARTASVKTWDGGASTTNWSDAANWNGDAVPQTGDEISLSAGSSTTINYNTATSQTSFSILTVGANITLSLDKVATLDLTDATSPLTVSSGGTLVYNNTSVVMGGANYNASLTAYNSGSTVRFNKTTDGAVQGDAYGNLVVNLGTAESSNGTITVANDFTNSGAGFSAGGGITVSGVFSNSGTIIFPATTGLSVTGTTTNTGTFNIEGSGSFTFTGAYSGAGTLTSTGTGTIQFNGAFNPGGNTSFGTQTLDLNGTVSLNGGTFTPASTTTFSGASLTMGGGSLSASSGTFTFDGSSGAQSISAGSGTLVFNNLTVGNTAGISSSHALTVNGTLSLSSGGILCGTNTVTLGNSGVISNASSSRFIDGNLVKGFASGASVGSYTFHTGRGGEYLPVSANFATANNGAYSLSVLQINSSAYDMGAVQASALDLVSAVRYWNIDGTGGTPTGLSVTLTWNANDNVSSPSDLRVAQLNAGGSSVWFDAGNGGTTGGASSGTITSAVLAAAGNHFTFGDDFDGIIDNSLPVELLAFTAEPSYSQVILNWSTASELNNQGFNLYRSLDGEEVWMQVNSELIEGQGNSSEETSYSFSDSKVESGAKYQYRLESVSLTGLKNTESVITVEVPVPDSYALMNNYPNPFNPTTTIRFLMPESNEVTIKVFDIQGQLVKTLIGNKNYEAGDHSVVWDASNESGQHVASGMYIYQMQAGSFRKVGKMVLMK